MEDWFTKRAGKWAIKKALALAFILSCGLAKVFPIVNGGDYRADAVLYMLFFGICILIWTEAQ